MHRLSYDLHIHSCLSPCGDEDMTPTNIVNMAKLKNLDIIAVTDHNSCKNSSVVQNLALKNNIIAIPGMELCTVEEVHVLCLFSDIENAMAFDAYVYSHLIKTPNDESIFGKQLIVDEKENIKKTEPYLLINATDITFEDLNDIMPQYKGIYIPAHIDKTSNSLLSNLGFIPPNSAFKSVEVNNISRLDEIVGVNAYLKKCRILSNSDAHTLGRISEPINFINANIRSCKEVIKEIY